VRTLFSRTRGTKINTEEIEVNKGATADLLQQKPNVEVADTKTPTVTSDKEILATGISTIGLHTKKLSGAQRKKLIRERKMKEGTWTENPPRKIPPPQVKGTAVYSGMVKDLTQRRASHS
jgi:hypothetical protein